MIFGNGYGPDPRRQWHRWFAWVIVRLTDGRFAWLQYVSRRIDPNDGGMVWEYKL